MQSAPCCFKTTNSFANSTQRHLSRDRSIPFPPSVPLQSQFFLFAYLNEHPIGGLKKFRRGVYVFQVSTNHMPFVVQYQSSGTLPSGPFGAIQVSVPGIRKSIVPEYGHHPFDRRQVLQFICNIYSFITRS